MKKLIAITLVLMMLLSLSACAPKNNEENEPQPEDIIDADGEDTNAPEEDGTGDIANMINPYTYYDTLDEINEITGGRLGRAPVMGVSEENYSIIDTTDGKIAQYAFEINGIKYTYRFTPDFANDVSGVYENGNTIFADTDENYVEFTGGKAARRLTVDGQYVLVAMDEGMYDLEQFKSIADEIFTGTVPSASASEFAGGWHEVTAGRATLDATADGSELTVEISWANSAAERIFWNFTGHKSEDGFVYYENGVKKDVIFNEEGVESEEILSENESGNLCITEDGNIAWIDGTVEDAEPVIFEMN